MSIPNLDSSLEQWLTWQEGLHAQEIDLGLERVGEVARRLSLPWRCPTISVAGTNGKGSCIHYIQRLLLSQGFRVGMFTSPHLIQYNERIRVDGEEVSDTTLVSVFQRINEVRNEIPLTYFEFSTLAALSVFSDHKVDVQLLEVGLGGRLDATNIVDADVAIVTSIDLDHQEWLGDSREAIGFEKAGIFRPGAHAVCGDTDPPKSIATSAGQQGTTLEFIHRDFGFDQDDQRWTYWDSRGEVGPLPHLINASDTQRANASCAIRAVRLLDICQDVDFGLLAEVTIPGRAQIHTGPFITITDVAHNPAAVSVLAQKLQTFADRRIIAVVGMLKDKDIQGTLSPVAALIDRWFLGQIQHHRGMDVVGLGQIVRGLSPQPVDCFSSVEEAVRQAQSVVKPGEVLLIFGSFHTVGAALSVGI